MAALQQIDIENHEDLLLYLRRKGLIGADERPGMTTLAGGVSNRTVLVERESESWVLKQALAKLRVAVDWFSDPARIEREAAGLRVFGELAPGQAPALIFEDRAQYLLAMEAVAKPHDNYKSLLLAGRIDDDHVTQFATLLACVHRESSRRADEFAAAFDDRSFYETLRIEPYYTYSASQAPAAGPFIAQLVERTRSRRITLVHGDYSPKNVLIHRGRIVLLDFEVIHFGDGAFDVGFAMTHYLSKAHHLPPHRVRFLDAARLFWRTYFAGLGDVPWRGDHEQACVNHTLGCMLARVRGRSPLEYLTATERDRQCDAIVAMMQSPPPTMDGLITQFAGKIG